jgi:hypothetical protein
MLTGGKRGRKPGTPKTGGRKVGTPNKATIEKALIAEREALQARVEGRKLARDVLDQLMHIFFNMAELYAPQPGQKPDPEQALQFERWSMHAFHVASELAPFQSPTYRAVMVAPSPETPVQRVTFQFKIFDPNNRATGRQVADTPWSGQ